MKRTNIQFCVVNMVLAGILALGGCGYDNPSGPASPSQANTQAQASPPPAGDAKKAPSPTCDKLTVTATAKETCRSLDADAVDYLNNKDLLIKTLQNIASKDPGLRTAIIEILNGVDLKTTLTPGDVDKIAQKVKERLGESPMTAAIPEQEINKIANTSAVGHNRLFLTSLLTPLLLVGLAAAGWFYTKMPFGYLRSKYRMRTHNEIRDESGGRWEVKLDGSLKSVTEKIAENNRAVLDLKNLLLDFWADWEKAAEEPPAFVPGVREEETYRDPAPPKVISLFEPEIPMPVSDYKDRMQKARILKLDRFGVYLEASPEGSGEFLLFRVPDSKFIVVPFFEIFDKPELFSTYYRNFYERTGDQSVGSVWIKKAALVGQTRQGWELLQKGVLEIR